MGADNHRPIKYHSAFDIIGPVMVGPSSSHTAGALRVALMARKLLGHSPREVVFELMGSFAETYRGHGTDRALAAGILGMSADDLRLPDALEIAEKSGLKITFTKASGNLYHPNTVRIIAKSAQDHIEVIGSSLGGGKIEIVEVDAFPVRLSGDRSALVLWHRDQPGFLATVLTAVANEGINVGRLSLERASKGGTALVAIEIDGSYSVSLLDSLAPIREAVLKSRLIMPV
ncbi:MAG: L-serine ammonia-lyase, iron-sulfur-dependent, subunit beta [Sulfobacillus benefaciens]|uniref:L-serine deaminase n=1 Tax=Sulfobacillus benefaciens TaxID=453960 RepID=A0A2T2X8Z6_9FIRM|nr:MAG: L-serine ammonia-lyase, iron-sulfur-dependent, subunit beta [Sulfobacillus benefaciens]